MKYLKLLLLLLIFSSCSKEVIDDTPVIDETPTALFQCNLDYEVSSTNKKTSHYNPNFVPFINYFARSFDYAVDFSCVSMVGKGFININNNDIPDLVFVKSDGCNEKFGTIYVIVDDILKYEFGLPRAMNRKGVGGF